MGKFRGGFYAIVLMALIVSGCQPGATPTATPEPTRPIDPVTLRVLFIGSSHIYYPRAAVDLPGVFTMLAASGGHTVITEHAAVAGERLQDRVADPSTLEAIQSAEWDYVVLQEDMYVAGDPVKREEQMYPAVRTLDQWIKDNGAQTILYLTWVHPGPIRYGEIETYFDAQDQLTAGTMQIAEEIDALVAPAGLAVAEVLHQNPEIYLWYEGDDAGHASYLGQYLTAAVFYALIYQESPEGLDFLPSPEDRARMMQSIAAETVLYNPR
jgi:hypothetical protein